MSIQFYKLPKYLKGPVWYLFLLNRNSSQLVDLHIAFISPFPKNLCPICHSLLKSMLNPDVRFISLSRRHDRFSILHGAQDGLHNSFPAIGELSWAYRIGTIVTIDLHWLLALQWCFCVSVMVQDPCALHNHITKNWSNLCRRRGNS